jgi:L,D-transpeptidase YnhG
MAAAIALATWETVPRWEPQVPTVTAGTAPARHPMESGDDPPKEGATTSAGRILASGHLPKGNAETRLIEVLALIESGQLQQALLQAEALTHDQPNFHLAHLVKADLLTLRYQPDAPVSVPPAAKTDAASTRLAALRTETHMRLSALRERPPEGHVPHQFLALAAQSRHAIAVDASRSRLYLFENLSDNAHDTTNAAPSGLRLIGDFFISVGKSGINKRAEGDGRTPLGAYYITSVRDKKSLPEFYGAGALPINYPNAFDVQQGRTGSGIWLHGSPPEQYVRAPLASDGCVVLSNPDMDTLLKMVEPRTTPVVIAEQLQWVPSAALRQDASAFMQVLMSWQTARSKATPSEFAQLFEDSTALTRTGFTHKTNGSELLVHPATQLGVANLSLLKWQDPNTRMVATFEETANGQPTGVTRRQYWTLHPKGWRLLQDTVMAGNPGNLPKRPATTPPAMASSAQSMPAQPAMVDMINSPAPRTSAPSPAQQVQQAVVAWAGAWSQKNVAQYLRAYAPSFDPPGGLSRNTWEQERRNRIVSKDRITITLSGLKVQVDGNNATVSFVQNYKADRLAVSSYKTLKMVKQGDQWLISQENVGGR